MEMKTIKKQLAVAVTVALLTLPLSTSMVLAETVPATTTSETTTPGTTTPETTTPGTTTPETTTPGTTTPETTTPNTTTPETTPVTDSEGEEVAPANWLTTLIVKLQLALAFDPVRKSELNERLALAKLAQAQELMTEGKTEASEIALGEYTNRITKAQEFLEQVEDPDSEKAQKLTIALTNVSSNNINVLSNLLDKLPPQAAQKLAVNVVRSMEKAVTKMEKQEAKAAPVIPSDTTSETAPAITPTSSVAIMSVEREKALEKQAKVALKDFKKSLKEKGTIEIEDADEDTDVQEIAPDSQEPSNSQPTSVTIAPAQVHTETTSTQSSVRENYKNQTKQEEHKMEKREDSNDRDNKGGDNKGGDNKGGDKKGEDKKGGDKKDKSDKRD